MGWLGVIRWLARETLRAAPRTCVLRLSHGMARSHPMARARNASGASGRSAAGGLRVRGRTPGGAPRGRGTGARSQACPWSRECVARISAPPADLLHSAAGAGAGSRLPRRGGGGVGGGGRVAADGQGTGGRQQLCSTPSIGRDGKEGGARLCEVARLALAGQDLVREQQPQHVRMQADSALPSSAGGEERSCQTCLQVTGGHLLSREMIPSAGQTAVPSPPAGCPHGDPRERLGISPARCW